MQYALTVLDDTIRVKLILSCSNRPLSPEIIEQWWLVVLRETEIVKSKFIETAFSPLKKRLLKQYFHYHQTCIIGLYNECFVFFQTEQAQHPLHIFQMQNQVFKLFSDLLWFMQTRFPDYFDYSQNLPDREKAVTLDLLTQQLPNLTLKLSNIDAALLLHILNPINALIAKPDSEITFYQTKFYQLAISVLLKTDLDNLATAHWTIIRTLLYLNFNSIPVFDFIVKQLNDEVESETETINRIQKLAWYLKKTNQAIVMDNMVLRPEQDSLQSLISKWLIEEIACLEKQSNLSTCTLSASEDAVHDFKILTEWSVPQFAFYLRMLIDIGILKNDNITKLTNFYANHLQTPFAEEVSPKRLRAKFYGNKDFAIQEVKAAVIKMLNYINARTSLLILLIPILN